MSRAGLGVFLCFTTALLCFLAIIIFFFQPCVISRSFPECFCIPFVNGVVSTLLYFALRLSAAIVLLLGWCVRSLSQIYPTSVNMFQGCRKLGMSVHACYLFKRVAEPRKGQGRSLSSCTLCTPVMFFLPESTRVGIAQASRTIGMTATTVFQNVSWASKAAAHAS